MSTRAAAALLCVLALPAACGGSSDPPDGAPAPSQSTSAASTSRSFDSVESARDEYLRLLEPSGRAVQALSALLQDPTADLEAVRRAVGDYATAIEQFGNALSEPTWPQQVAQPISELSAQLLAQVEPTKAAAQGATPEEIQGLLGQVPAAAAAEKVRVAFEAAGA